MRFTDTPATTGRTTATSFAFWSSWRGWALVAALGGSAGWLAGCASRTPLPPAPTPGPVANVPVPSPRPTGPVARTWAEFKVNAAQRLVSANEHMTYLGVPPEPLLAIPVIEVELTAEGHIAKIEVLRQPSQAKDTTQMAIDAIKRAAPFGDVSRLPKPWKYSEAFLFDDNRRFKPRTLDQ